MHGQEQQHWKDLTKTSHICMVAQIALRIVVTLNVTLDVTDSEYWIFTNELFSRTYHDTSLRPAGCQNFFHQREYWVENQSFCALFPTVCLVILKYADSLWNHMLSARRMLVFFMQTPLQWKGSENSAPNFGNKQLSFERQVTVFEMDMNRSANNSLWLTCNFMPPELVRISNCQEKTLDRASLVGGLFR